MSRAIPVPPLCACMACYAAVIQYFSRDVSCVETDGRTELFYYVIIKGADIQQQPIFLNIDIKSINVTN